MKPTLTPLGHARVYRHPATGELVVDTDSIRRAGFAGDDFGYEDEFEGDDYDDDFGYDDDFEGEDDFGEEDDDEFGARGRRRARRRARKQRGGGGRRGRRAARRAPKAAAVKPASSEKWGMTAIGGTDTLSDAGAASINIRLQHDFRAQDLTFTGSASGAKVTSIFFADRVVWSNSDGIDVGVFASNGFLRGLLKGQSLRAGLDITVNGNLSGAGDFAVTLIGEKPVTAHC